eukprot:m.59688 g.59688  ORF g.59688 m.59688 type:complete len:226 (-) comp7916_c0_seq2:1357-2034(-)
MALPSSLLIAVVGLVAIAVTFEGIVGIPCPPHSTFLFSVAHDHSYCMCDPNTICEGACISGSNQNNNSFREDMKGFLPNCKRCGCKMVTPKMQKRSVKNGQGHAIVDAVSHSVYYYDFQDKEFDAECAIDPNVDPPPAKAIPILNWMHIPKCGSSAVFLVYNFLCRKYKGAPQLKITSKQYMDFVNKQAVPKIDAFTSLAGSNKQYSISGRHASFKNDLFLKSLS